MQRLYGELPDLFKDEEVLREIWSQPDTRKKLLHALGEKGFLFETLKELQSVIDAEQSDIYDVLAFIAFAAPMAMRKERAAQAKQHFPSSCTDAQRAFLDFVLEQYVHVGVAELDMEKLSPLMLLKYNNSLTDAVDDLGDINSIKNLFVSFQKHLYE